MKNDNAIPLVRLSYRVTRVLEDKNNDGDKYYEIGLDNPEGRRTVLFVEEEHVAASMTIGSTVHLQVESEV